MNTKLNKAIIMSALIASAGAAQAATYVYVSNAEDGKVSDPTQVIPTARNWVEIVSFD